MPITRTGKHSIDESSNTSNKMSKRDTKKKQKGKKDPVEDLTRSGIHPKYAGSPTETMEHSETQDTSTEVASIEDEIVPNGKWTSSLLPYIIAILALIVAVILISLSTMGSGVVPVKSDPKLLLEFENCIRDLHKIFPKQENNLWERMIKKYKYNSDYKRSVMCHTLVTHSSNLKVVNCLVKKLSNCLGESQPFTFTPSKDFQASASELEQGLNKTSKRVGYFEKITEFLHPLPFVFQSICDSDYSPYKKKTFYFSITTEDTENITRKHLSQIITDNLVKHWVTGDISLSEDETAAVITRIADISYFILQEDAAIKCE